MTIVEQKCKSCHSNVKILLLNKHLNKYVCTGCYNIKPQIQKTTSLETMATFENSLNLNYYSP